MFINNNNNNNNNNNSIIDGDDDYFSGIHGVALTPLFPGRKSHLQSMVVTYRALVFQIPSQS